MKNIHFKRMLLAAILGFVFMYCLFYVASLPFEWYSIPTAILFLVLMLSCFSSSTDFYDEMKKN